MDNTPRPASGEDSSVSSAQKPIARNEKPAEEINAELGLIDHAHGDEKKFHQLGWKKLTICLLVEAIALGALSIPKVFATVGMLAGIILSLGIGLIAIYTSYLVGEVKMKYPQVKDYADAVGLCWGRFGYELTAVMFVMLLVLIVGSHTLTGTIAFVEIIRKPDVCAIVFTIVAAILLFVVALPPTFAEFAILGYIDFGSIIVAIMITIIATGVQAHKAPGGLGAVDWTWMPPADTTFYSAFLSCTNIIFAYSFAVCQFSFMSEMHTPKDYIKSIWALGLIEIVIYTGAGALIYAFVGSDVASPALKSAGTTVARVAFGVALPVIFISGSINTTVACRYVMDRFFKNSEIRLINSSRGWSVWIGMCAVVTIVGWLIAQVIPFFEDLLGIISALFISGFTFYFPALFWFCLLKEGKWNATRKNIMLSIVNGGIFLMGMIILGCGVYASVKSIVVGYAEGTFGSPFSCSQSAY